MTDMPYISYGESETTPHNYVNDMSAAAVS